MPSIDWPTARSFMSGFLLRRLAQPEPLTVERHPLCGAVLLSDVESFTAQVEHLVRQGPDGLEQVISAFNRYFCVVGDAVKQYGGDLLGTTGDSFLCFWPAEDGQELADATALAGQAALAILEATREPNPTPLLTRIGIAAGEVDLGIIGGVRGAVAGDPTRARRGRRRGVRARGWGRDRPALAPGGCAARRPRGPARRAGRAS